jgi:Bacterial membrane protein YfhO
VIFEVLLLAPHGIYANRADPYPSQPWIGFLQSNTQDHSRVFSTDGILFPNISTAYGLSDIRAIDALYPERYWTYIKEFISPGICCLFSGVGPPSNVVSNPMFDLLGVRYLVSRESRTSQPSIFLMPQFRPVYHADDLNIYENGRAVPRAFVVHSLRIVPDMHAAATLFANEERARFPDGAVRVEHFDPRSSAVVESKGKIVQRQACGANTASAANIVSYSPTHVKISVTNDCPGLLVLSDQYFPGWSATVNGRPAHIYPTDIALRGVTVPAGMSTVEFHYRPKSFRNGLILFALGLVALLLLGAAGLRSSPRWHRRRRSRTDSTPEPRSQRRPPPAVGASAGSETGDV